MRFIYQRVCTVVLICLLFPCSRDVGGEVIRRWWTTNSGRMSHAPNRFGRSTVVDGHQNGGV
jgi:hypothetical protein